MTKCSSIFKSGFATSEAQKQAYLGFQSLRQTVRQFSKWIVLSQIQECFGFQSSGQDVQKMIPDFLTLETEHISALEAAEDRLLHLAEGRLRGMAAA